MGLSTLVKAIHTFQAIYACRHGSFKTSNLQIQAHRSIVFSDVYSVDSARDTRRERFNQPTIGRPGNR